MLVLEAIFESWLYIFVEKLYLYYCLYNLSEMYFHVQPNDSSSAQLNSSTKPEVDNVANHKEDDEVILVNGIIDCSLRYICCTGYNAT